MSRRSRTQARPGRGMALAYVVIVVGIVGMLVAGFSQFRSSVLRATSDSADELLAREAAEAGVNAVLAEMQGLSNWQTHDTAKDVRDTDPAGSQHLLDVTFSTPLPANRHPVSLLTGAPLFLDPPSANGAYCGHVAPSSGFGVGWQSEFKVKVATFAITNPSVSDDSDLSVDIKTRFFRIVALGRRKTSSSKRGKIIRLAVLAEASNLTEYTIYDGGFLDLGMGMTNDSGETNDFSVGRLYGAGHLALADIESNGTKQKFTQMGKLLSNGPIIFADSYAGTTFGETSSTPFTLGSGDSSPWHNKGGSGQDLTKLSIVDPQTGAVTDNTEIDDPPSPLPPGPANNNVEDKNHGGTQAVPEISKKLFDNLQTSNSPMVVSLKSSPAKQPANNPGGWPDYAAGWWIPSAPFTNPYAGANVSNAAVLFFGRAKYTGTSDDPLQYSPNIDSQTPVLIINDTGLPLSVWGNPDRDVTIYSPEDVYIGGDFNQNERHDQTYGDANYLHYVHRVQFLQNDKGSEMDDLNPPSGTPWWDNPRRADNDPDSPERRSCAILSDKRIWYDYRIPSRLLRNELKPYIEYLLIKAIKTDDTAATVTTPANQFAYQFLASNPSGTLQVTASCPAVATGGALDTFITSDLGSGMSSTAQGKIRTGILGAQAGKALALTDIDGDDGIADQILNVLEDDEKSSTSGGFWTLPQKYFDAVFSVSSGSPPARKATFDGNAVNVSSPNDRFYIPEQTINAVLIDSAERNNDAAAWSGNPHSVSKIFPELGNSSPSYLTVAGGASPIVGRIFGSEIHLRTLIKDAGGNSVPNIVPPKLTVPGIYNPHKRKRIYDRTLRRFPPGFLPRVFKIWNWEETGLAGGDQEFDQF